MEILLGMLILAFIEALAWLAWRSWRGQLTPRTPQPRTHGQLANQEAFDDQKAYHPVVVSLRYRRRGNRGRSRRAMEAEMRENEGDSFLRFK